MNMMTSKACLVGGGTGSLAAAAFTIRDGKPGGDNIVNLQAQFATLLKEFK